MQPFRLLLVDNKALFREGLISLLSYQHDFTVVGEAKLAERLVISEHIHKEHSV